MATWCAARSVSWVPKGTGRHRYGTTATSAQSPSLTTSDLAAGYGRVALPGFLMALVEPVGTVLWKSTEITIGRSVRGMAARVLQSRRGSHVMAVCLVAASAKIRAVVRWPVVQSQEVEWLTGNDPAVYSKTS